MTTPALSPPASIAPAATANPLESLRIVLARWDPPAGADGFEGLVAQALAALTGYTFRLARSGSQFGRDSATPNAPFSIAMEAKRYNDSVPLQELAGKAALAAFELAEGIDVWALAATVEVSEPTQRKLEELLESGGITLLTLDWTAAGLPPLAVLLAAASTEILPWAKARLSADDYEAFRDGLEGVAEDGSFEAHREALLSTLSSGLLGLDAFRHRNVAWCEANFASRRLAQRAFSQFLVPLESPELFVERPLIEAEVKQAVENARNDAGGDSLVVVLGGEGSGKSWSVAKWWLNADPRPILVLSVGRMSDHLSSNNEPVEMLARLAAHQDGGRDEVRVRRWRRRLERWSAGDAPRNRFAIFLDGLNETSGKAWSTILQSLLPAARALGGVVIATCREAYWEREIERRLPFITFHTVHVADYDDAEFAELMRHNDADIALLPERLDKFMRTPRICSLALTILPQLSNVQDLSIDRLLIEYWRARLLERGDLLGHDDVDFRNLLMRHAREYRAQPGTDFNRDEWRSRSGAAQRSDGRDLANDLTEIEEGRFFDLERGAYRFREETLHFALGLLVTDELRNAAMGAQRVDEALAKALDPVRGFDAVADIMISAISIAALDTGYPDHGIAALVRGFLSLQNINDDAFEALVPFVGARPEPFLDAFESRDLNNDDGRFLQLLLRAADRDAVSNAIDARVNRWLGSWSRDIGGWGDPAKQQSRREQRNAEIDAKVATLTEDERKFLHQNCAELASPTGLAGAAAVFLLGVAQVPFARGIVAFALAHTVAGSHRSPFDDVAWSVRLNRTDFELASAAIRAEIAPFLAEGASQTAREAAARALRIVGSLDAQIDAEAVSPPSPPRVFGQTRPDPLAPDAVATADVQAAVERVNQIDPGVIWNHMSTTSEDHDLERSMNLLVRFDRASAYSFLDGVAKTIETRSALPLRQLAWHLPWLTPIIEDATVKAIRSRISDVVEDPSQIPDGDQNFVTGMMVEAVFPRLDEDEQLDLLQSLPPEAPFYMRYSALAKPLDDGAARRLGAALSLGPRILERTLLFLSANPARPSRTLREHLLTCLNSDDLEVCAAAADFARNTDDSELDEAVLNLAVPDDKDDSWRAAVIRSARASAIARLGRPELVDEIPVEHIDWVAARLPAARERLADAIDDALARFILPIDTAEPSDALIVLEVSDDPTDTRINLADKGERAEDPIEALNAELSDTTGARFDRRQRLLRAQLDRFLASLKKEGALIVAQRPYGMGLEELACEQPDRYARWLERILQVTDRQALRCLQNLGFTLAQNYASVNGELAGRTFVHLWGMDPHVTIQVDAAKHTIRDLALFNAASGPEIDRLRTAALHKAKDDRRIEQLVVAAEFAGAASWLDAFVTEHSSSPVAADQALAITVASLRQHNAQSDGLLARDWRSGFLGEAARVGRDRYNRARHAAYWFEQATGMEDRRDRWAFLELGIAAADRRQLIVTDRSLHEALREIGGDVPQRLRKSVEKTSEEREKSLYGNRKPTGLLAALHGSARRSAELQSSRAEA